MAVHKNGSGSSSSTECDGSEKQGSGSVLSRLSFKARRPTQTTPIDTTWRASFLRWSPLLGVGALLFVFLSIPAAAIVLHTSDGDMVEQWKTQPSVFLSVITGIGNKALGFAALQGAIITWWLRALDGTTMQRLHYDWQTGAGSDVWAALTAGRKMNMLAVTTLCSTIILLDGILLQKATTVVQRSADSELSLEAMIAPELPSGYSAYLYPGADNDNFTSVERKGIWYFNKDFTPVQQDFFADATIPSPAKGCPGRCTGVLQAAALSLANCTTITTGFMNLTAIMDSNGTKIPPICTDDHDGRKATRLDACPLFDVMIANSALEATSSSWGIETISVLIGMVDQSVTDKATGWAGNFTQRGCTFLPAIGEYPVTFLSNGAIEVDSRNPKIVAIANNTAVANFKAKAPVPSTLAGVAWTAATKYTSSVLAFFTETGMSIELPAGYKTRLIRNADGYLSGEESIPVFEDPLGDITEGLNSIMFRASIHAAQNIDETNLTARTDPGRSVRSTITAKRVDAVPTFQTRWSFFAAAAAIQLVCGVMVAVTFWGYWRLGRTMSFSPLEIANAFDAAALRDIPSNMAGEDIAERFGGQRVRYGAVKVGEGDGGEDHMGRRLAFGSPESVYRPMGTFKFVD